MRNYKTKYTIIVCLSFLLSLSFNMAMAVGQVATTRNASPYLQTLLRYKAKIESSASETNLNVQPQIVGGTNATQGAYPWMVALLVAEVPNAREAQFCGGSLVAPDVVVTAAHCVDGIPGPDLINVAVGAYDLRQIGPNQRVKVRGILMHENYSSGPTIDNDIAIIKLATPQTATTLSLITPTEMAALNPGDMLRAIGFGVLSETTFALPNILQEVPLAYVDHAVCDTANAAAGGITNTQICAGTVPGQDSCFGDSGGPLMANINGVWRLTGIVSWGISCGGANDYGVYTEAADFVQWVADSSKTLYVPQFNFFDFVGVGEENAVVDIVENWGDQDITVNSVSLLDPNLGYVVGQETCSNVTLAPNETCSIEVKFNPFELGRKQTELQVQATNKTAISKLRAIGLEALDAGPALNAETLNWYSGVDNFWQETFEVSASDSTVMQAGPITDAQISAIQTYVEGRGRIQFEWKVSSELNWDFLYLVVDGQIVDAITGDLPWQQSYYDIADQGKHAVTWVYFKDGFVSDYQDTAWLNRVSWRQGSGGGGGGGLAWISLVGLFLILLFRIRSIPRFNRRSA